MNTLCVNWSNECQQSQSTEFIFHHIISYQSCSQHVQFRLQKYLLRKKYKISWNITISSECHCHTVLYTVIPHQPTTTTHKPIINVYISCSYMFSTLSIYYPYNSLHVVKPIQSLCYCNINHAYSYKIHFIQYLSHFHTFESIIIANVSCFITYG